MKTLNFIFGLLIGIFLMFIVSFALQPPTTSQIFIFLFGGMAIGSIFTGILGYLLMDRIVQAFYFSLYKRKSNDVIPVDDLLEDENDKDDWMMDPDWWKKQKPNGGGNNG